MELTKGIVLIAIAIALLFLGLPDKSGQHLRFLQFEAAVVLYPPVIVVFFVMGAAEIITWLLGISR